MTTGFLSGRRYQNTNTNCTNLNLDYGPIITVSRINPEVSIPFYHHCFLDYKHEKLKLLFSSTPVHNLTSSLIFNLHTL